jgi:hypothetical protein
MPSYLEIPADPGATLNPETKTPTFPTKNVETAQTADRSTSLRARRPPLRDQLCPTQRNIAEIQSRLSA